MLVDNLAMVCRTKSFIYVTIISIFLGLSSILFSDNLKNYDEKAQEAPEAEASAMLLHDETDEIDQEIEKYFKQISSPKRVDVDFEKLKKISKTEELASEISKEERVVFSNVSIPTGNFINHKVSKGDTIWNISKKYRVEPETIVKHNPELETRPLYIDEEIMIVTTIPELPVYKPTLFRHVIRQGDNLSSIAERYNVSVAQLCNWNGISTKSIIHPGVSLIISKNFISSNYEYRSYFTLPISTGKITSGFGSRRNPFARNARQFHRGIDIGANIGTPFYAAREGVVILSGRFKGYGNCIFIRHTNGYVSIYGHNKVNLVKRGDVVARGQFIGRVGRTGMATGPHLHFEIRDKTVPINPNYALTLREVVSKNKVAMKVENR